MICFSKNWLRVDIAAGLPSGSAVKNLPAVKKMQETWVRSLGWEDPLEEGMATHSSILAWRILGYSPWGCKESDMTEATEHACTDFAVAKRYLCWGQLLD